MKNRYVKLSVKALSYLLVIAITASFLVMISKNDDTVNENSKDEISFKSTKYSSEWVNVAENDNYALFADLGKAYIYVYDKIRNETIYGGQCFDDNDDSVKKAVKSELASLLNFEYADRDSNVSKQNSNAGSVNKKKFSAKKIKNGIYFEFYFPTEGFVIPLSISLSNKGIDANVPLKNIKEESDTTKLTSISILPNFRAASSNENGNIFVPDGSGALIPFGESKTNYSGRIYGKDISILSDTNSSQQEEQVYLPVFGVCAESGSYLGIVTSGEARGEINTNLSTQKKPYSSCYTKFIFREVISVNVSNQTFESTKANMFEPSLPDVENFSVSYRFTDNTDYVALASEYREYLIKEKGISSKKNESSPLHIKLIGGIMHTETVLGFPVQKVLPITTYTDVLKLADMFNKKDIQNISFDYIYWNKSASDEVLTTKLNGDPSLGNKKELQNTITKLKSKGYNLYLDGNFTSIYESQSGISVKYDTAKNVKKEPLAINKYSYSTNKLNNDAKSSYLLSLDSITKCFNKFSIASKNNSICSFSLNRMGNTLYSDFSENSADRTKMQKKYTDIFNDMKKSGNDLLFSSANAYTFEYADVLSEIPIVSGDYYFETTSIPFYAIALHGLCNMSVPSINQSENSKYNFLKAIECGIGLSYTYGYQNTNGFSSSNQNELYYLDYKKSFDNAVENTLEVSNYLKKVSDKAINKHSQIMKDVYETVFEDGTTVITNYNEAAVEVDGNSVASMSYIIK